MSPVKDSTKKRVIVALDTPTLKDAETVVKQLGSSISFYKFGFQLVLAGGLELARELSDDGNDIFLDMKLLDIDNTVEKAVENVVEMGFSMLTLHAYPKAMRSAVKAALGSDLCLLGVTVLTSMDDRDLADAGYSGTARDLVLRRALDANAAGMGGIVASAQEAAAIRQIVGEEMAVVTPGIRPSGSDAGDQKRVMTPKQAIQSGASHLVVGRPITQAPDPWRVAEAILAEID